MNKRTLCCTMVVMIILSLLRKDIINSAQNHGNEIKGSLVIVGGALESNNSDIYNKFISMAGGEELAKIGIIPTASFRPMEYADEFKYELIKYGVLEKNIYIIPIIMKEQMGVNDGDESILSEDMDCDDYAGMVKDCTGIWFLGGDQNRITSMLLNKDGTNTRVLDALWNIYMEGAVLGGTSAGAAAMSEVMIAGGDSLGAIKYGVIENYEYENISDDYGVYVGRGLGFFKYGIIDQHFDKRARLGRLIIAALEKGDKFQYAYGIDENTAMVVDNINKTATIIGTGNITVIDTSSATKKKVRDCICVEGIGMGIVRKGDVINLQGTIENMKFYTINEQNLVIKL